MRTHDDTSKLSHQVHKHDYRKSRIYHWHPHTHRPKCQEEVDRHQSNSSQNIVKDDVEVVMLFPCAINYRDYGFYGFIVGAIFLTVLFIGMIYEWRKGDLEWDRSRPTIPNLNLIKTKTNNENRKAE